MNKKLAKLSLMDDVMLAQLSSEVAREIEARRLSQEANRKRVQDLRVARDGNPARQALIDSGKYTEKVMARAEELFAQGHPTGFSSKFETWLDTGSVPTQSYFAKLAQLSFAREMEIHMPPLQNEWKPWELLEGDAAQ